MENQLYHPPLYAKIDPVLNVFISIRLAEINGFTARLQQHIDKARELGLDNQRINAINRWRKINVFSETERAVFSLTEEMTGQSKRVSLETYNRALKLLGEPELARVMTAISVIHAWKRIALQLKQLPVIA